MPSRKHEASEEERRAVVAYIRRGRAEGHLVTLTSSQVETVLRELVERRTEPPAREWFARTSAAVVDLDEGHRMSTNIVGCAPEAVHCGMPVAVTWDLELSDGRRLPLFRPPG